MRGWSIPTDTKKLGSWAWEVVEGCSGSLDKRRMQGQAYRNLFLTGDESGDPQTYPIIFDHIDNQASYQYSPVDLRFSVTPYGQAGPRERSMGRAAGVELTRRFREASVDMAVEDANLWSLVKGKTFLALYWSKKGFEPHVIQPEVFGVLRDDISSLDRQDAFFHQRWMTPMRFADMVEGHPKAREILRKAAKYKVSTRPSDQRPGNAALRQILVGAPYGAPFQPAGTGQGSTANQRNQVFWLTAPEANLAAKVSAELICLHDLWLWDRSRDDWTTISLVGPDCIVWGDIRQTNMFAEYPDPKDPGKVIASSDANALKGHHPYIEFCPNRLDDYFWGDPEIRHVALIQRSINKRVNGINHTERMGERPPRVFHGMPTVTQNVYTRLNKPGGYLADAQPGGKVDTLKPDPADWTSLHEWEAMFNKMAGMPATLRGEGESGVRAQAHAETLVRTGSPRIKDRALAAERSADQVGGLGLDLLRARCLDPFVYWVKKSQAKDETDAVDPLLWEPPVSGDIGFLILFGDLDDRYKVSVDGHSSSPAFEKEEKQTAVTLSTRGAIGPVDLVRRLHPDNEDEIIADIEERQHAQEQLQAQVIAHPDLAKVLHGGKRR